MSRYQVYAWPTLEPPPGAPDDDTYLYSIVMDMQRAQDMVRKLNEAGMACRVQTILADEPSE